MSLLNDERTDKLIDEIGTRPALYNKNLKEYSELELERKLAVAYYKGTVLAFAWRWKWETTKIHFQDGRR
jgi:hypothetical protein